MQYINGINEITNPLVIIAPIFLMTLSGFATGHILSIIRKVKPELLRDFTSGSIILIFLFISGFIIFGVIGSTVKEYFFYFTIALSVLSALSIFFLSKLLRGFYSTIKNSYTSYSFITFLFGMALFSTLIAYNAMIIYHHPIFLEYDPVNNYLLTSKSILLGNGLHHDYYGGVDIRLKSPPLTNSINSWIMDFFGYSSLRLFPIYFMFISSLFVYRFSKKITHDSFFGWISSTAFLITPAIFISNSRFSLYPDIIFILSLIASFYFFAKVITVKKIAKNDLLMLIISSSIMILSREVGLIIAWAILFIVLYVTFSNKSLKKRLICSVISFLPFYMLSINDFHYYGITAHSVIRLIEISLASMGIFYVLSYFTKGEKSKIGLRNLIYFIPLVIPMIFITINVIDIHGPYASIIFSDALNKSVNSYKDIMGIQDTHNLGLLDSLEKIPHIDILFTATLLGTLFIFFKISGLITVIRKFKINPDYAVILVILILQLAVWAYLELGTDLSQIRHISYFAPIFSIILVLGLRKKTIAFKLFYYGIIVFSVYYFLLHDVLLTKFNGHFGGFWIDGYRDSTITLISLELSAVLILILSLLELKEPLLIRFFSKVKIHQFLDRKYFFLVIIGFSILLSLNVITLLTTGVVLDPPEKMDLIPQNGWELNQMEVIDFLNHNDKGNVLSLQNQAIPFFTNRTSFELYDGQSFASMYPLLQTANASSFKQKISQLGIKYFIFPNEDSPLFNKTQRFNHMFNITNILENDSSFNKVRLKFHTVYKLME